MKEVAFKIYGSFTSVINGLSIVELSNMMINIVIL